jgi:hypothetical protein
MTQERILDRVKKLLNLANDQAATEGERDNALRMAHATLMKHALTLDHLDAHTREKEDPREKLTIEGWNLVWCRYLRMHIADLFFCKYYVGAKINATRGRHSYVGRASNTATAAYMSDWIIAGVLKEADRRYKHRLTPEGRSFCEGVVRALQFRVKDILAASQTTLDAEPGNSLVVADFYRTEKEANALWAQDNMTITEGKSRKRTAVIGEAYHDGVAHGKSINLSKQIATTAAPKQIS